MRSHPSHAPVFPAPSTLDGLLSSPFTAQETNSIVVHLSPFYNILKQHSLAILQAVIDAASQAEDPMEYLLSKQGIGCMMLICVEINLVCTCNVHICLHVCMPTIYTVMRTYTYMYIHYIVWQLNTSHFLRTVFCMVHSPDCETMTSWVWPKGKDVFSMTYIVYSI